MSDLGDVERMFDAAERAAAADDLASADELLKDIARIQEAELGPLHPDLAKTLNNRAVVAERTGRMDTAEGFYRQAVAIATASLPADHPMVAASRENLQEFCRARGLPIDDPRAPAPAPAPATAAAWGTVAGLDTTVRAPERHPAVPRKRSRALAKAAIGIAVVLVIVSFLMRSRDTSTSAPTAESASPQTAERTKPDSPQAAERTEPVPPQAAERAAPGPAGAVIGAPMQQGQAPTAVPRSDDRNVPAAKAPTTNITLITAQLCRTFSTGGARWTCDPAGDPVSPGPIVLYTRVRSPAAGVVVHRWYRGDTLRQSVKLMIRASPTEGYRTYSRQTVDSGEWRVEVSSAAGAPLHEQRFVVR